ncbi:hypothetical protein BU14_0166s0042 [Porphyra umbilicalis]|uniref:Uncharacterized protein n=1 Tax=Porphyra umbilicalis TaxID=2786 RepID=A0A1X6P8P2_PORUM|nr:hypothetical protein BU14_0166s0042 [Porphyra umbilicalis]|eukprot:OSX77003.1 hypothetical protein BU14_0166s0042 [Porphyra umbilicalis]
MSLGAMHCVMVTAEKPVEYTGVWSSTDNTVEGLSMGGKGEGSSGAAVPDMGQRRRGGVHGQGGRRKGTGHNTLNKLEDGYVRALALTLSDYGLDRWISVYFPGSILPYYTSALETFVQGARDSAFCGEVCPMEVFVGAASRFNKQDQPKAGNREVVSCWVASRGNIVCTCMGSTKYEAGLEPQAATVPHARCAHASAVLGAVTTLADALGEPPRSLLMHSGERFHEVGARSAVSVGRAKALAGCKTTFLDEIEVYDTGGLPVAIVVSGTGLRRVPAPTKCARKATLLRLIPGNVVLPRPADAGAAAERRCAAADTRPCSGGGLKATIHLRVAAAYIPFKLQVEHPRGRGCF